MARRRARAGIGLVLQPEAQYLDCVEPLLPLADYLEVAPETLWWHREDGELRPNGYHARFAKLREKLELPFVAHGVGYSVGSGTRGDAARRRRWLTQVALDHRTFDFRWWTDHLGATVVDGLALALPLPLPMTAGSAAVVRRRLAEMQRIVPDVGVENSAQYFVVGDPLDEPAFLRRILSRPRVHLLLDLHNIHTMAVNLGFDPAAWLARAADADVFANVIEIHVAGGSWSDPAWLPSGRELRLDGHDAAVPEPVWDLLGAVLPRCTALRGVTLERMEGTVTDADVPELREELHRLRSLMEQHG
jgi:uncharacterized protein (UPF0276 family)